MNSLPPELLTNAMSFLVGYAYWTEARRDLCSVSRWMHAAYEAASDARTRLDITFRMPSRLPPLVSALSLRSVTNLDELDVERLAMLPLRCLDVIRCVVRSPERAAWRAVVYTLLLPLIHVPVIVLINPLYRRCEGQTCQRAKACGDLLVLEESSDMRILAGLGTAGVTFREVIYKVPRPSLYRSPSMLGLLRERCRADTVSVEGLSVKP